jgi:site-specific DNA-methyltransferase (adenine-specific)
MLPINKIYNMDCLEGMKLIDDNSIDSIVTDPPYELGFMGKKWDSTGIAYNVELWQEALRVLKPGGHLLAFGGTRTYHRMVCAIEDAGFEIHDQIQWIYGSGFPKSMDISKAIDKKAGAKREVIKTVKGMGKQNPEWNGTAKGRKENYYKPEYQLTASATPEAKQWDGWGTALKPANEPIVVARKPLSEKTVAENVLKWGTGGLNIDGCRVESGGEHKRAYQPTNHERGVYGKQTAFQPSNKEGRFPANVILDEEAGKLLDEQSGISKGSNSGIRKAGSEFGQGSGWNKHKNKDTFRVGHNDSGGASRFFYCAKASKKERGEGNTHPTVKPLKLISYLITLVTPPNGICLDIFEGSGTHALACIENGFKYIGFELEKKYYDIATERIENHKQQLTLF